ncbi:WD40-repeat-containing domain protein [Xylariomycetidae sp. FL0641]|nr:WD40-repeat-containing domain protein [Xylariomycetidae sp. FL0641]
MNIAMAPPTSEPSSGEGGATFDIIQHGHKDLVQAIAFNTYGDRCATGGVDGKIRVFNRHKDGVWRLCDNWNAHSGEVLELQWLPPTIYPNLLASLGIEGRFKLWAEDPSAAPGQRFSSRGGAGGGGGGKASVNEMRSKTRHPFRSFSARHDEASRATHFAFLAADGHLSVYEGEQPELLLADLALAPVDDFQAVPRPANRGDEAAFTVRFDPNPEPCYAALRAGVPQDALGLVVAGCLTVRVFRTRDTVASSFGAATRAREFYLAVELAPGAPAPDAGPSPNKQHLVRDVAWAPASYRGYDMVATAGGDGAVRVYRIDTPPDANPAAKSWAVADVLAAGHHQQQQQQQRGKAVSDSGRWGPAEDEGGRATTTQQHGHGRRLSQAPPPTSSGIRAELDKSDSHGERTATGQPGQVAHVAAELCRLECHRSPVWRVDFDDDGQILGSVGDDGRLVCYRQRPDGAWAKSSELGMLKMRMAPGPMPA